ncbi:MAG TPA: dockerin type I domain-containing protein, partial [Gemmatimonadaceae bacterium]|nr:dockerin type I domain-containing protein [Gemmatimonadaceae bacterium]
GRIAAIVPAATPGGPMYIGTASGGVWRSTNNGISWAPLTDAECVLTTGAMARDPSNASIVYAATGEGNGGLTGCGVLRSSDGGNTWTTGTQGLRSSAGGSGTFTSLVVDPASAGTATSVLIGTTNFGNAGVVRSTNAGATWSVVHTTGPGNSIVAHPTRAGAYYVSDRVTTPATSRGVYRSVDIGATWTALPALPVTDATAIGRIELAVNATEPTSLWALVGDRASGGMLGLFKYDETSNAWTQLAASGVTTAFGTQQSYDLVLAIDPRDTKRIFIAGVTAFRSTDGGATFTPFAREVHSDWHVIVFDRNNPDIVWAGTDGGVYLSTDAGGSWVSRSAGLSITQFYPGVSVHPQGTRIAGGTQDNGTNTFSGSLFWDAFIGADGGYTAINYRDPSIQWGETQWSVTTGTVGNLFRRDITGTFRRNTGIDLTDRAQFIPPLVMDPVNPSKLYFGTFRLYRTVNEGLQWTPITGDLSAGTGTITSIGISPADTNTIYIGTNDGRALVSRDGGTTVVVATGLPARSVTRVVPHPTDPLRALITVSGFGTGHVFETTDAFATPVKNISGNLIDAPTNVALYLPSAGATLVGTDVGVFQTTDNITWTPGPTGLPNVIIQDLVYQPAINLLVAGTYGRGMFAYDVGASTAVLRGDANGDGKIDAFDALLIQQTLVGSAPAGTVVYPRGDANCNGSIDAADLVLVLRAAVGLPTGTACVGSSR